MNKNILVSLGVVVVVGVAAVAAGTGAFFSDTESTKDNTFTAGSIDLKVDYSGYYNKAVDNEPNAGSWQLTDLTSQKFFDFADLKPGDYGEGTISLHVDDNDAWACMTITPTKNDDVTSTEPELEEAGETAEDPVNLLDGELAQNLTGMIWADVCAVSPAVAGDNVYQAECDKLIDTVIAPLTAVTIPLADKTTNVFMGTPGPLVGSGDYYIGTSWSLPLATGNIVQSDSYVADIAFSTVQHRNNTNFRCLPDTDEDGDPDVTDCSINDPAVYHGATEVFNDKDDNCDGLVNEGIKGWVKPTSYTDASGTWEGEWLFYDGAFGPGYGGSYGIPGNSWGNFVELNLPAETTSNQVRYYIPSCAGTCGLVNQIDVDVYRGGVWTDVYQGAFNSWTWETKSFTEGSVTKARMRLYNSGGGSAPKWIDEFEFYANN